MKSLLFALALLLAGCESSYKYASSDKRSLTGSARVQSNDILLLGMARDGVDGTKPMPGSGRTTTVIFAEALEKHTKRVITAPIPETLEDSLARARKSHCDYVFLVEILDWADRATEYTAVRDRLQLRLEIFETTGGRRIYSDTVSAKSPVMTDGSATPKDLILDAATGLLTPVFQDRLTPSAFR